MSFSLSQVVPWGRSYTEYVEMFALDERDLGKPTLGVGDGPASFNAELTRGGGHIVSCDPLYRFGAREIRARIDATAATIGAELRANTDEFVWTRFDSVEDVIAARIQAMNVFLDDFAGRDAQARYIDASLPDLPFADASFDLVLCSHFLFLYSEQHDLAFHLDSIRELVRVAREVRIFPLVELGSVVSRHLGPAVDALRAEGWQADPVRVGYEFQRGGNEMLRISRS